jgi:CheY-like chemotaxis protein
VRCEDILIVEDDEAIRDILTFALESRGYSVFTAANGEEGLQIARNLNRPCLILLDLMMPILDGWAFAKIIESDPVMGKSPIVVVTASCESAEPIHFKEILHKPIDVHKLYSVAGKYANAREPARRPAGAG